MGSNRYVSIMLTLKGSDYPFLLFCCKLLRVGSSREVTMNRDSVHREGRLPPCEWVIHFSEQIIPIGSRTTVIPVVRLFSYEAGFLQVLNGSLHRTA